MHKEQRPWTDAERALLRRMRRSGVQIRDIASALNRSRGAIQRQVNYLGIQQQRRQEPKPEPPAQKPEPPPRAGATTLPPLPSLRDDAL